MAAVKPKKTPTVEVLIGNFSSSLKIEFYYLATSYITSPNILELIWSSYLLIFAYGYVCYNFLWGGLDDWDYFCGSTFAEGSTGTSLPLLGSPINQNL